MARELELSSWTVFKEICIAKKNLTCQFMETSERVDVYGPDANGILWHTSFLNPSADFTDFADYRSSFNWAIGNRLYPWSTGDFEYQRKGMFDTVNADNFDLFMEVWEDGLYLNGGTMYCGEGFVFGTWAEMAIVDHANLLGFGVDTVLKTWVISSYPSADGKCELLTPYAGNPPKGMYIRVRVHRVGSETFPVVVNLNWHMAI